MNRIEIETTLNNDRVWLLNAMSELSEEQLVRPLTPSEHDASNMCGRPPTILCTLL